MDHVTTDAGTVIFHKRDCLFLKTLHLNRYDTYLNPGHCVKLASHAGTSICVLTGLNCDVSLFGTGEIYLGRSSRPIPEGLPEKLLYIRLNLDMTQKQMLDRLQSGLDPDFDQIKLYPGHISDYENGIREPPLRILMEYARIAKVPMEVLANRWLSLPGSLTSMFSADFLRKLGARKYWAGVRRARAKNQKLTNSDGTRTPPQGKAAPRRGKKPK